jgi:hypothetical protein
VILTTKPGAEEDQRLEIAALELMPGSTTAEPELGPWTPRCRRPEPADTTLLGPVVLKAVLSNLPSMAVSLKAIVWIFQEGHMGRAGGDYRHAPGHLQPRLLRLGQVFADQVVATAIVDRDIDNAIVINIRGRSYRMRSHHDSSNGKRAFMSSSQTRSSSAAASRVAPTTSAPRPKAATSNRVIGRRMRVGGSSGLAARPGARP